jgi:hypothetical protein
MIPEVGFRTDLVVGIVPMRVVGISPDLVVEIVPDLVVEIIPDLVVEMFPARDVAETVRTNVIVQEIDASFFIVLLLVLKISGVCGRLKALPTELIFGRPITNN